MNDIEIKRLAHAINELRPAWPISSLTTFISRNLAGRNYRDVAVALVWVALDADGAGNYVTETPKRVMEPGPWWRAAEASGSVIHHVRRPPKRDEECPIHIGEWADNCRCCKADRLSGEPDPKPQPRDRAGDANAGIAACREQLHAAKGADA